MNMKRIKIILTVTLLFLAGIVLGQEISKSDIEMKWADSPNPGRIRVTAIKNKSAVDVRVFFNNEYDKVTKAIDFKPGQERHDFDVTCNLVKAKAINGSNDYIQIYWKKKEEKKEPEVKTEPVELAEKDSKRVNKEKESKQEQLKNKETKESPKVEETIVIKKGPLVIGEIIPDFLNYLESIPFYSLSTIDTEKKEIEVHINNLKNWKDKAEYIKENQLNSYINSNLDTLSKYSEKYYSILEKFMSRYADRVIKDRGRCTDSIQAILKDRARQRENNLNLLSEELNNTPTTESFEWKNWGLKIVGFGTGCVLLLIFGCIWFIKRKSKKNNGTVHSPNNESNTMTDASSSIVIRRKTTSILRKQSLDDIIGNDAYLTINCSDFCDDSSVRKMYIKNTCIKDIYNMYAEDLRNPNNPKEDGCMVLGRWVHDADSNTYDVSLEHVVLPGDDAVFTEYELNFGGKIKLKVTERLRKLRRETNLQYDLTCWVHSHPGLGVFFSNSDSNVQMQLKHPTHPNFLTAIVIDILTPQQEMGFFTFKRDSSINSKADLKKMYSLEELYKRAVESDRMSFRQNDYYNTLADAKSHQNDCYGIELSNGAIIDMGMLVAENNSGLVGMVHGFSIQQGLKTEYVASTLSKNIAVPDCELIGCFVIATHCSIPSIRKVIVNYIEKIKFVLVYTTTDGLLTSIPVNNQKISTDEVYYGEQKLEDLKIWTRRKR